MDDAVLVPLGVEVPATTLASKRAPNSRPEPQRWTIQHTPEVMESIRLLCAASFIADGAGVPIIGLLYGKRSESELRIEAWIPAGELRSHNDAEFALKLQMRLAPQRPETAGLECLGWVRTRNHGEPRMVEEDRSLFDRCFPASWQMTMLVRPSYQKPTKLALFQRRTDGEIRFDRPAQEFFLYPASEEPIESPMEHSRLASPADESRTAAETAGEEYPSLQSPTAAGSPSASPGYAPVNLPANPPAHAPVSAAELAADLGPDAELLPRGTVRAFSPWIAAMLMIVGLMAGSGVAALRAPAEPPTATAAASSPLRVLRDGNTWVVHWEKSLADLPGVSGARLSVTRDGYTKDVALPLLDFRSGSTRLDWVSDEMDLQLRLDRPGYPEVEQRVRVVGMNKPRPTAARTSQP